jgi:hypothetical protein
MDRFHERPPFELAADIQLPVIVCFNIPLVPCQPKKEKRNLLLWDCNGPFGSAPGEPGLIGLFTSAGRLTRLELPDLGALQFARGFAVAKALPEA